MLLSGTGNPELSEKIAREIDLPLAPMDITRFADGEFDVKIHELVRGHDVFLDPAHLPAGQRQPDPAVHHPRRAATRLGGPDHRRDPLLRVPAQGEEVRPPGPHLRQADGQHHRAGRSQPGDRRRPPRRGHPGVLRHPRRRPHRHQDPRPPGPRAPRATASWWSPPTPAGRSARAPSAASSTRPSPSSTSAVPRDDAVEVVHVIGDVAGKHAVIVDDLISTGGTLVSASEALRSKGAIGVDVIVTHGLLTDGAAGAAPPGAHRRDLHHRHHPRQRRGAAARRPPQAPGALGGAADRRGDRARPRGEERQRAVPMSSSDRDRRPPPRPPSRRPAEPAPGPSSG